MRTVTLGALLLSGHALAQFCPSHTLSSAGNTGSCAVEAVPGTNPTLAQWQVIFDTVSKGPSFWGASGPNVSTIGAGCNRPNPPTSQPARFPCELIKAISMQESGWRQFCPPTTPADQRGKPSQTIISFDCGYGVGQVTSGMRSFDATPSYDRSRVASDALYNLATGMQILTEKWRATNCVGDNQPRIVEHWYSATWAYNGLSSTNNPNNPAFSTTRGVCRSGACPSGSAPYQERVWGWMEFPPSPNHWRGIRPAYPRLSDVSAACTATSCPSRPIAMPDPTCAGPASCTATRALNVSECLGDGGTISPPMDAGVQDAGLVVDAGSPDAGVVIDAGSSPDAGQLADAGTEPSVLQALPTDYPASKGCGCGAADGTGWLALLGWCLTRVARRRGKNQ